MKISLIDYDKTGFPNLALMKISAWHKAQGNNVKFYEPLFDKPDKVFASKVFRFGSWNMPNVNCKVDFGGTGFYLYDVKVLANEIEHTCPDYELYGKDFSMGFITRGCIRNCSFCIVPKKEGEIYFNAPISEFQRHKKVMLLDNNILACEQGIEQLKLIAKTDTLIDVNQGLDFRLVDNSIAELLANLHWIKGTIRTACDSDVNFEAVKKAVEMLGAKGVKPYRIFCYTLVKSKADIPRILELDKLGIKVFAMGFMDFDTGKKSQDVMDICRWVNRKQIFSSEKDFAKYRRSA
jgi:radical SAM superfamily enzyme YgiQ (UPF0313 family)